MEVKIIVIWGILSKFYRCLPFLPAEPTSLLIYLTFLSKIVELVVARQFMDHTDKNGLLLA